MRRLHAALLAASAAVLVVNGCESPTSVTMDTAELGPVVALDSLRLVDGAPPPCCNVDSAGARVTVIAGTLTFWKYLHFTDTVFTPAGAMSAACVTEIPNFALVHINGLVTVGDSVGYLIIPCHVGGYTLALTRRRDFASGFSETADDTVSSGTYSWKRDTLALVDGAGRAVTATMVWDTVVVAVLGHTYKLQAVRAY